MRSEGRSWAHPYLVMHARPSGLARLRVGVAVGKKLGGAVRRNKVRRRIREWLRPRLSELPSGWDVILTARAPAAEATFADLGRAIDELLARANLPPTDAPP